MEIPQETKQRYFELFSNAFSPSKARPAYIAEMKAKLGDEELIKISAKRSTMMFGIFAEHGHQIVPNQSEFGLESVSWKSNWNWFEKSNAFLGLSFPNQTGFGLEKDTE